MLIDLHAHTTASDGTDTPSELIAAAVAAGLDVVALTDHDSTAGWAEAEAAARAAQAAGHRLTLVRGIEVTCKAGDVTLHLLGYLHDPSYQPLLDELTHARESRDQRAQRIVERLAADVPISYDDVLAQLDQDRAATVGRPHIADALVANAVVASRDEAFRRYLHHGSPYYVGHYAPDAVAVVRLLERAGGVSVMAHPFAAARGPIVADSVIEELAAAGLAALEAHHPDHSPEQVAHTLDLARALRLPVTGSSDYHGAGRAHRLGDRTTEPDVFAALIDGATATPLVMAGEGR